MATAGFLLVFEERIGDRQTRWTYGRTGKIRIAACVGGRPHSNTIHRDRERACVLSGSSFRTLSTGHTFRDFSACDWPHGPQSCLNWLVQPGWPALTLAPLCGVRLSGGASSVLSSIHCVLVTVHLTRPLSTLHSLTTYALSPRS